MPFSRGINLISICADRYVKTKNATLNISPITGMLPSILSAMQISALLNSVLKTVLLRFFITRPPKRVDVLTSERAYELRLLSQTRKACN